MNSDPSSAPPPLDSSILRERLHGYDLDALLAFTLNYRLIDGHDRVDSALIVTLDGEEVRLDHDQAVKYLRAILRAYAIGTGQLPPLPLHNI